MKAAFCLLESSKKRAIDPYTDFDLHVHSIGSKQMLFPVGITVVTLFHAVPLWTNCAHFCALPRWRPCLELQHVAHFTVDRGAQVADLHDANTTSRNTLLDPTCDKPLTLKMPSCQLRVFHCVFDWPMGRFFSDRTLVMSKKTHEHLGNSAGHNIGEVGLQCQCRRRKYLKMLKFGDQDHFQHVGRDFLRWS